jgi:phage gp36-like protein
MAEVAFIDEQELHTLGIGAAALRDFDSTEKTAAIVAASSEACSYLRNRHKLPLPSPYDGALKMHVASLAVWTLMKSRGFSPQTDDEVLRDAVSDARKYLRDLATGKASLTVAELGVSVDAYPQIASDASRGLDYSKV